MQIHSGFKSSMDLTCVHCYVFCHLKINLVMPSVLVLHQDFKALSHPAQCFSLKSCSFNGTFILFSQPVCNETIQFNLIKSSLIAISKEINYLTFSWGNMLCAKSNLAFYEQICLLESDCLYPLIYRLICP